MQLLLPNALRGRLRPGTVYAVSGPDGSYTLMVSVEANSASRAVALSATHPRFPGLRPESVVPQLTLAERFAIGNLLTRRDIVFPRTGGVLDVPPTVTASHAPALPGPGVEVAVVFTAMDDSTPPDLRVTVQAEEMGGLETAVAHTLTNLPAVRQLGLAVAVQVQPGRVNPAGKRRLTIESPAGTGPG